MCCDHCNKNRLVQQSSTLPSTGPFSGYDRLQLTFAYDWLGRRVRREVFNLRTSIVKSARRYGYDGWNLIAEFDESSGEIGALQRSYTGGLDQTGSLAATGGVGALVQLSVHNGSTVTDYYPTYDANGNVAALVKNDGTLEAARAVKERGWGEVAWLIGADMVQILPTWHQAEALLREVTLVVARRPGYEIDWSKLPEAFQVLRNQVVAAPMIDISASAIRARVRAGRSIRYMVPPEVEQYIAEHRLYGAD